MPAKRLIARHALLSLLFLLIYLLLNQPQVIFLSRLGSVAWYPANGLVLALLVGINPWYGFLVAFADALAGFAIYQQSVLTYGETVGAVGVAAWYSGAAFLLRGPLRISSRLRRGHDVVRYVFVTMTAVLGASITGVFCLVGDHSIRWDEFGGTLASWYIGDGIGILGFAPFLLIHVFPRVRDWLRQSPGEPAVPIQRPKISLDQRLVNVLEGIGQAATILSTLWVMFGPRWGHLELFYLSFIPILWMAMRNGIHRVVSGILALNFGIIVALHLFPPEPALLAKIGLLMLVVSASGLIVGSTVTERQQMGAELHQRTTYLNSLIENSPLGIVVLGRSGRVELVNDAFTRLSQYQQSELVGSDLDSIFLPAEKQNEWAPWADQVLAGNTLQQTVRRLRKDGTLLDLELHAVPLLSEGRVQGAYTICKDISEQIKASIAEREHADALSRLVRELELQTDQMSMLNELAGLLECCATTKEACTVVIQSARKLFPEAAAGTLYTFRASRNLVEAAASWGNNGIQEPVFSPQSCWALRRGQPHWTDIGDGIACPHLAAMTSGSHLCLPMVGQGDTLGVLHIEFAAGMSSDVRYARQRLGMTVAGQIALSLASLQLRETLRDQSIRDPLTGLFNRRFMQESVDREMMRAKRKNHPLSILFLDIDHFKRFNDTFGHDAGDLVLQAVAELLRRFFRGDDVTCRSGGEEFAVILPESVSRHAAMRANDLREEMKKLNLRYKEITLDPISISVGVASYPEHGTNAEDLLKIADQCLYQSKNAGRDRVTVAVAESARSANPSE